jgi:hypothetical protein
LLYQTRLWWDGRRGLAMLRGRQHLFTAVPPEFEQAEYIDFAPEVRCAQMRTRTGPMRDMEADEVAAANRFLEQCHPQVTP